MNNDYLSIENYKNNIDKNYDFRNNINNSMHKHQYFHINVPYNNDVKKQFNLKSEKIDKSNVDKLYNNEIKLRENQKQEFINKDIYKKNNNNYNDLSINFSKKYDKSDYDPLLILKSNKINKNQLINKYLSLKNLYNPDKGGNKEMYLKINRALIILIKDKTIEI